MIATKVARERFCAAVVSLCGGLGCNDAVMISAQKA